MEITADYFLSFSWILLIFFTFSYRSSFIKSIQICLDAYGGVNSSNRRNADIINVEVRLAMKTSLCNIFIHSSFYSFINSFRQLEN